MKSVIELGNTGAVKHAVMAGLGLSIISRMAVVRELEEGRLCSLRIADLALHRLLIAQLDGPVYVERVALFDSKQQNRAKKAIHKALHGFLPRRRRQ